MKFGRKESVELDTTPDYIEQPEQETDTSTEAEAPDDGWSPEEKQKATEGVEKKRGNKSFIILITAFVALVAAGGVFMWMLTSWRTVTLQTAELAKETTATEKVIVTTAPLDQYTDMTIEQITGSLQYLNVYKDAVPEGAITDPSLLVGLTTNHDIAQNAILTESDFTNYGTFVDADTVEISFPTADLAYAAAGEVKPGDKIVIGFIDKGVYTEFYETTVYKIFDGGGTALENGKGASMFSVLIPRSDVSVIYTNIQQGTLVFEKQM